MLLSIREGAYSSFRTAWPSKITRGTLYVNEFDKTNAFNKFFHGVFMADDGNAHNFNQRTNANLHCPEYIPP